MYPDKEEEKCQCSQKCYKPTIVSFSDAGANPWTMMIKPFYTNVAAVTVGSARRTINEACGAELETKEVGFRGQEVKPLKIGCLACDVAFIDGD